MAEILAGKEGEERLLFKSVGGRPPTAAPPKDLKKEKEGRKTRISDAAKKLPRNVRLLLDKPRVHFEGRRAEYRLREFQSTHPKKRTKRLCQAKSTAPEAWPGGVWPWGVASMVRTRKPGSRRTLMGLFHRRRPLPYATITLPNRSRRNRRPPATTFCN